jgi:hypothetical protein
MHVCENSQHHFVVRLCTARLSKIGKVHSTLELSRGNIFAFELTNNCVGHILSTTLSWWHMFQGPVLCLEILDMSPAVLENPDKLYVLECTSRHTVLEQQGPRMG